MVWKSFKNPPKQNGQEIESKLLKFAKFDYGDLIRIDEGRYNFVQGRFCYEDDKFSDEPHATTVNCTHWMYEEDYWKLLEELPKEE